METKILRNLMITLLVSTVFSTEITFAALADCEEDLTAVKLGQTTGFAVVDPLQHKPFFMSYELQALQNWHARVWNEKAGMEGRLANDVQIAKIFFQGGKKREELIEKKIFPMSSDTKKSIRRQIDELNFVKNSVSQLLEVQVSVEKMNVFEALREKMTLPVWAGYLSDHIQSSIVMRLEPAKTVSLLLGGSESSPTAMKTKSEALKLARGLKELGYTLIYDADSDLANELGEATGAQGVGISSGLRSVESPTTSTVITIKNDYLRMMAFHRGEKVVASPHSVPGMSILIHLNADFVLDPKREWRQPLKRWEKNLNFSKLNLGVAYEAPLVTTRAEQILNSYYTELDARKDIFLAQDKKLVKGDRDRALSAAVDRLNYYEAFNALEYAKALVDSETALKHVPGGSVFFGSATYSPLYNRKIFESARAVGADGIPVWTGGAGGFMRVANAGAFASGASSVGIPIGGRSQLSSETKVFRDVQTSSFAVPEYSSRIPLLLKDKQVVVVVPGRSGTLKEVAVTLLKMAGEARENDLKTHLFFLDNDYYHDLVKILLQFNLPTHVKDRIHLTDSPRELLTQIKRAEHESKMNQSVLRQQGAVEGRNLSPDQVDFLQPPEKKE